MDDTCCFHDIRLGPKTSVYHVKVVVVSTALGCDVTNCATTLQGFNKQTLTYTFVLEVDTVTLTFDFDFDIDIGIDIEIEIDMDVALNIDIGTDVYSFPDIGTDTELRAETNVGSNMNIEMIRTDIEAHTHSKRHCS